MVSGWARRELKRQGASLRSLVKTPPTNLRSSANPEKSCTSCN